MNISQPVKLFLTFSSAFFFLIAPVVIQGQVVDTAENQLLIQAQFRPRSEIRSGAFRPLHHGEKPAALISQRTRVTVDYKFKDVLSLRISPQSVSVWGQANTTQGIENSGNRIALFEAWAKLNFGPLWSIKLGRQIISLDDERFFGELDWAQGGRAHDALTLQYEKNKFAVKTFLAYNQNYKNIYNSINNPSGSLYSPLDALSYKLMQTVWAGFPVGKKSNLSFLATNLGLQQAVSAADDSATTYYSQTFGANYFHNSAHLSGNLSAYFQTGKDISGRKTQAYMLAAGAGYQLSARWSAGVGTEWLSGNNPGQAQTNNHIFTPYFHTGHKFYGAMDYFYAGNPHRNVGLSDNFVKLQYKTKKNDALMIVLHQFYTPNKVLDGTKKHSNNLGQEVDITCTFKLNKYTGFSGGYSFYLPTTTLQYLKNTPDGRAYQQWIWMTLNVSPVIFKNYF